MSDSIREELWKALADSPFIMVGLNANDEHSEPMTAQLDKDANSAFWIYTTKTNRIAKGGAAMAQFSSKDHKLFACISGTLKVETDPNTVDKYWSKQMESWYELGRDDPGLCVLRFDLNDAEIWTVEPGVKGMFKLFTNNKVEPEEVGKHEKIAL